jgi:hypothetical protein
MLKSARGPACIFILLILFEIARAQNPATTSAHLPHTEIAAGSGMAAAMEPQHDSNVSPPAPPPATTTLEVRADVDGPETALVPVPKISGKEVLSSAGTFGDVSRYLQVLPGVVWSSDLSNGVLVRGGNPEENLFVIDGVEFPGISHFSLAGTTGGFASMLDATAMGDMTLRSGPYDASYSSRLSSLIEIHTRPLAPSNPKASIHIVSSGISGVGGLYERALGGKGTLLLSGHRSILNLFTNNIGIGGVPIYTNGLAKLQLEPGSRDSLSFLSLTGADSIQMTPCAGDAYASNLHRTQYAGWRSTDALTWQHTFNAALIANLTTSFSGTRQQIAQQQEEGFVALNDASTCAPLSTQPTYLESSWEGLPQVNYSVHADVHGWLLTMGAAGGLTAPNDAVEQPVGQLSPFSARPLASDAVQFHRNFATGQTAEFVQAEGVLGPRWRLMAGLRAESFALDGSSALEPRFSLAYRLNGRQSLHLSWNSAAQLPPTMDMISYAMNRNLPPIEDRQVAAGMRLWQGEWGTVDAEAYQKRYTHEPVSTEYPQLMLFNMVDTRGQSFSWLPLTDAGSAEDRGLEGTLRTHWSQRLNLLASATWSQSTYRALDGVRRPGNYDIPVALNAMSQFHLPKGLSLDARETLTSGRVYCPFDIGDSLAQDRGIYDLARINAVRGPMYNRLDAELERTFHVHGGTMTVLGGADNTLNRGNVQGYVWLPNCGGLCSATGAPPVGKIDQMGRFPEFSARYEF